MNTSVLDTRGQSLALPMVLAILAHGGMVGAFVAAEYLGGINRTPILDVEPVQVSLQLKPHTDRKMVQKETRAPVPKGAPEPKADPKVTPPPVVSEMKRETPDAPKPKGAPDRSDQRNELLKQLMMQNAKSDAMEGAVDRLAASPDSETDESINNSGPGVAGDPELARYEARLQALFRDNFRPLPTLTGMDCTLSLTTDPATGDITKYWISKSSGNASYDAACERAAVAVRTVPLPPEKWAPRYANGYNLRLRPKGE